MQGWGASLSITVIDGLVLFTPSEILVPPTSRFTIRTNQDHMRGRLHYRLLRFVNLKCDTGKLHSQKTYGWLITQNSCREQPSAADCQLIIAGAYAGTENIVALDETAQVRITLALFDL